MKILILVIVVILAAQQCNCGVLDGLTQAQKNEVLFRFTGGLVKPPGSNLNKNMLGLRRVLTFHFQRLANMTINMLTGNLTINVDDSNVTTSGNDTMNPFDGRFTTETVLGNLTRLINRLNACNNTGQIIDLCYDPETFSSFLPDNNDITKAVFGLGKLVNDFYLAIDFSEYVPNIDNIDAFWNRVQQLQQFNNSCPWYADMLLKNSTEQMQLRFMFEIPDGQIAINNLIQRVNRLYMQRQNFTDELLLVANNYDYYSFDDYKPYLPIMKYLSCHFLRRLQFPNVYAELISQRPFNSQNFAKLSRCSFGFLNSAADQFNASLSSEMPDFVAHLLPPLADSLYKTFIEVYDIKGYDRFNWMSNFIEYASPAFLRDAFSTIGNNASAIALLYDRYLPRWFDLREPFVDLLSGVISNYLAKTTTVWGDKEEEMYLQIAGNLNIGQIVHLLTVNNNYKKVLKYLGDTIPDHWAERCSEAMYYYNFAVKMKLQNSDPNVTIDVLAPLLICKPDCEFSAFLANKTNQQKAQFGRQVMGLLNGNAQKLCGKVFGDVFKPASVGNASDLANITNSPDGNVPLTAVYKSYEIAKFSSTILQAIAPAVKDFDVDSNTARQFIRALPNDTTLNEYGNFLIGLPSDYFANLTADEIVDNIGLLLSNAHKLDLNVLSLVVRRYVEASPKAHILNLLQLGNKDILQFVQMKHLQNASITLEELADLPVTRMNLPDSVNRFFYGKAAMGNTFTNLNVSNVANIAQFINAMGPSDFARLTSEDRMDMIARIGEKVHKIDLNSVTRRGLLGVVLNELQQTGGASPNKYWRTLDEFYLSKIPLDIFLELGPTDLQAFSQTPQLLTVVHELSHIPAEKCCNYPRQGRQLFAANALNAVTDNAILTVEDLDRLGPCLTCSLPLEEIITISPDAFSKRLNSFKGGCLQLSASESATFGTYLNNLLTVGTISIDNLEELIVFVPRAYMTAMSNSDFKNLMGKNLNTLERTRNVNNMEVQRCRGGLSASDSTDTTTRLQNLYNQLLTALLPSVRRRRRDASSLTCSDITDMKGAVTQLTSAQLQTIPSAVLIECLSVLGSYSWSSDKLTTLASMTKAAYGMTNITSDVIASLGQIALGFAASDLALLDLSNIGSISKLGLLDGWSVAQMSALATNAKAQGLTVNVLSAMFNIACGLSQTDVNTITNATLQSVMPVLSRISAATCPSLTNFYTLLKSFLGSDLFSASNLAEMGSFSAGMPLTDFNTFMTPDLMTAIPAEATALMPAEILNALPESFVTTMDTAQLVSIINGPRADELSPTLLTSITEQTAGGVETVIPPPSSSSTIKPSYASVVVFALSYAFVCLY